MGEATFHCSAFLSFHSHSLLLPKHTHPGALGIGRAHFGRGIGNIYFDDVDCDGSEENIMACDHRGVNIHNCGHGEDASVLCRRMYGILYMRIPVWCTHAGTLEQSEQEFHLMLSCKYSDFSSHAALGVPNCKDGDTRLVNGRFSSEGRVEICFTDRWGTICDGQWGPEEARVVCRQQGFMPNGRHTLYIRVSMHQIFYLVHCGD